MNGIGIFSKQYMPCTRSFFNLRFLSSHRQHHQLQKFTGAHLRHTQIIFNQKQQTRDMSKAVKSGDNSAKEVVNLDYVRRLASLEAVGSDRFRSQKTFSGNPLLVPGNARHTNVFGGLLFAHSVLAAEKTVAPKFSPHAAHSFFIRTATIEKPIDYVVTRLRDGNSFSTRLVQAIQDGHVVFCSQVSLCTPERSAIEHQTEMPTVPAPEELKSDFELARAILHNHEEGKVKLKQSVIDTIKYVVDEQASTFEFRPVEPNLYMGLEQHSLIPIRYWLKCNVPLEDSQMDRSINRFLLGFITDATMISTAIRPHTTHDYKPSLLTTLDHTIHYHDEDYCVDNWLLCENFSTMAKNGRAYIHGHVWTRDGRLILSCSQEGLCRTRQDRPISKL